MPYEIKTLLSLINENNLIAGIAIISCAALWRFLQHQTNKFQDRLISQIEQQHKMNELRTHQKAINDLSSALNRVADVLDAHLDDK